MSGDRKSQVLMASAVERPPRSPPQVSSLMKLHRSYPSGIVPMISVETARLLLLAIRFSTIADSDSSTTCFICSTCTKVRPSMT